MGQSIPYNEKSRCFIMNILVFGEEHIRNKITYYHDIIKRKHGCNYYYYADDRTGLSVKVENFIKAPAIKRTITGYIMFLIYIYRAIEIIREKQIDIVEIYVGINNKIIYIFECILKIFYKKIPIIHYARGEQYYYDKGKGKDETLRKIFELADLVFIKEGEEIFEKYGVRLKKTLPLCNSVPIKEDIARENAESKDNVVLYLNSFKEFRRIELLVEAFGLVKSNSIRDCKLVLVGLLDRFSEESQFYQNISQYERKILKMIDLSQHKDSISCLPFTTDPERIKQFFLNAKVFCLPSELVYCNYSLLEALSYGVPCIVTNDVDRRAEEIVSHAVNGLLAKPNPGSIADSIVKLIDSDKYYEICRAAQKTIYEKYNIERNAEIIYSMYKEITKIY
ncbi:MAG: glycosyltransferase family 4 protein [Synergistales bacterium]